MQDNPNPSPVDITVESLGGLGDGIATYRGKPLFIAKSCAGDRLSVRIEQSNRERYHGTIIDILQPGPQRRDAPCPHYAGCGGCMLQHLDEDYYRNFKTRILRTSLSLAGFPLADAEVIFLPAASRRRAEFKVRHAENNPTLAFYAPRSHVTVAITACMVLTPALQALVAPLNALLPAMPFVHSLRTVRLTEADTGIDMALTFDAHHPHPLAPWQEMAERLEIARLSLCFSQGKPITLQRSPVAMRLGNYLVPLLPGAFLQATAQGQNRLTDIAMQAIRYSSRVIDLFAGMGTYSFPLSAHARTHAVEGDSHMAQLVQQSIKQHAIATLSAERRDLFTYPVTAKELAGFDTAVINPPRAGAKAQTEQLAGSSVSAVVMISCNPATFTRDAKILKASGFNLESAQGIDQFIWSPHLEIAAIFRR